jgi:hypothetical protein
MPLKVLVSHFQLIQYLYRNPSHRRDTQPLASPFFPFCSRYANKQTILRSKIKSKQEPRISQNNSSHLRRRSSHNPLIFLNLVPQVFPSPPPRPSSAIFPLTSRNLLPLSPKSFPDETCLLFLPIIIGGVPGFNSP